MQKVLLYASKHQVFVFFILYFSFCVIMDLLMYYRVQKYAVRPVKSEELYVSSVACDLNPFCTVTVKGMMLDYLNFYVLGPLASLAEYQLQLHMWISPNFISVAHIFVAILAGRLVASEDLRQRRIGTVVFQVRSWLDDLDGVVARGRYHIQGEHSDVGSIGYYVDALCDTLGCLALLVGIFFYLKSTTRRGAYRPTLEETVELGVQLKKRRFHRIVTTILLITGTLLASSLAWNRYIDLYQNLLEVDGVPDSFLARQAIILRSGVFLIIATCWRLVNPHALIDYILVAIFIDRIWEYIYSVRWINYIVIFTLVCCSDFHYIESYTYMWDSSISKVRNSVVFNDTHI